MILTFYYLFFSILILINISNFQFESAAQELARRLFLFSYYCYGISFIDAALLTSFYERNKILEAISNLEKESKNEKTDVQIAKLEILINIKMLKNK